MTASRRRSARQAASPAARVTAKLGSGLVAGLVAAQCLAADPTPPLQALHSLDVASYMGVWYQTALYPNGFQSRCISDTAARYRLRADGNIDVLNRCRDAAGKVQQVLGVARPDGAAIVDAQLRPATLQVSFLPALLRWTGLGWGRYWVVDLASDGRYAIVSEPGRQYLWVLSRTPKMTSSDTEAVRLRLGELGFDLSRLQAHPQTAPLAAD